MNNIFYENNIKYIEDFKPKKDINNIENKILIKSLYIKNSDNFLYTVECMKKLNDIKISIEQKIELIAIGNSNHKILIINTLNFNKYQILEEHEASITSFDQYKNDSKFLFSSSNDKYINIYKLNSIYKYELIQKIKNSEDIEGINKVICLSNKLLVAGDIKNIIIWKLKINEEKRIYFQEYYKINLNRKTCNLLEVNPSIFASIQPIGGYFQIYENDGKEFPLIGEILINIQENSSNSLCIINNKLVCYFAVNLFYIICIDPLQIIQKYIINFKINFIIFFIQVTKDNYLYLKGDYQSIIQYKIINYEDNNFVELVEIGKYPINKLYNDKAILPFDDGRIISVEEKKRKKYYQMIG